MGDHCEQNTWTPEADRAYPQPGKSAKRPQMFAALHACPPLPLFQHYRLFFRYHATDKIIVYSWVNDENSKRAYESKNDAYRVFRKMLDRGNPPGDWKQLLAEAKKY